MLVRELDEAGLLARILPVLPRGERTMLGSGDDCAEVATPERSLVVTTDALVAGEHFVLGWSAPDQIGERAAAQNLADVAAMGGRTSALLVSLVVPPSTDVDWLVALAAGFGARARAAGAGVVGGDLTAGPTLVLAVTALGWCAGPTVRRSGARPGDTLAIAGTLGRSGAGCELLVRGLVERAERREAVLGDLAEAVDIYRAPRPPLAAGPLAARHGAHAMMDVSDGLVIDAQRMADASGVGIELDRGLLGPDVRALAAPARAAGHDAWEWVLRGGEDHPLLAALPPSAVVPGPFRPIGRVCALEPGATPRVRLDGEVVRGGWDHFRRDAG